MERHIRYLVRVHKLDPAKAPELRKTFKRDFGSLERYLFPDVAPCLVEAKQKGGDVYLLSFCDPQWQRYKVSAAGLSPWIKRAFYRKKPGT